MTAMVQKYREPILNSYQQTLIINYNCVVLCYVSNSVTLIRFMATPGSVVYTCDVAGCWVFETSYNKVIPLTS